MKHVKIIDVDESELRSKLDAVEANLGADFVRPLRLLLDAYLTVVTLLGKKNASIKRLRKLLFGSSSERSDKVLPEAGGSSEESSNESPSSTTTGSAEAGNDAASTVLPEVSGSSNESPSSTTTDSANAGNVGGSNTAESNPPANPKPKRKGHGRRPASAYSGCEKMVITHGALRPGDPCPDCGEGSTLYRQSEWSVVIRLKGQAPVGGTAYQLERLRCHICEHVFTAELPADAGTDKHDPSVASVVAMLRYGQGFPWNRIQRLQELAGVPLPASTQWELVRDALPRGIKAMFEQLCREAAQGSLVHNDDTWMRVLELKEKLNKGQPLREDDPDRTGVFTTSFLSRSAERPPITVFVTGPYHSGENLRELLAQRAPDLPPPIQMCDSLSRNMPEDLRLIVANCLAHARRNFVDVVDVFPEEVTYVLECLKKVYRTDAEARKAHLSPQERLQLHQRDSRPVMDDLHGWLKKQIDEKLVEPNSSLGGAIKFMLKHWQKLTLFLRVAGAPLDNNLCEQVLKMSILHRKNSLFYKTMNGAYVGDVYMTLIHTCYFAKEDPIDYLTQLQRHAERVIASPGDWLPWNYRQQLVTRSTESASGRAPPD